MYNKGIIIKKDNITLNKDIFIKTMQEYLDMLKFSDKESDEWWKKSLDKLIDGKIAMCTVYSNHASNLSKDLEVSDRYKLGNCNVPNNKPMLGGGVLGITNNTEHLEECIEFLKWVIAMKFPIYVPKWADLYALKVFLTIRKSKKCTLG